MDSSRRPTTPLELLHEWNCANVPRVQATVDTGVVVGPQHALLYFIAVATPNEQLVQDIATNFQEYVHNMSSTMETHFVGSHEVNIQLFDNVPDAVSPVKAQLVYTQVPHGDSTTLRLVWKVCIFLNPVFSSLTVVSFVSLKSRCKTIGTRPQFPLRNPIPSSPSWTGPPIRSSLSRKSRRNHRSTMFSPGD